jgi:hypothetical protein
MNQSHANRYSFSLLRPHGLRDLVKLRPGGFMGQRVFYGVLGVFRLIALDTAADVRKRVQRWRRNANAQ